MLCSMGTYKLRSSEDRTGNQKVVAKNLAFHFRCWRQEEVEKIVHCGQLRLYATLVRAYSASARDS